MKLNSRLHALRADAGIAVGSAGNGNLKMVSRRRGRVVDAGRDPALLARASGGKTLAEGLLCIDRVVDLKAELGWSCSETTSMLNRLPAVYDKRVDDWVYLDTETTGLSGGVGNLAFMVGLARVDREGRVHLRQYLLTAFCGEARMLRDMLQWIGEDAALVSYNGKCFDLPLLLNRLRLQRQSNDLARRVHLDLLYSVRRAWRNNWPDCRLQTAEQRLLQFYREDDLPGAQAPVAWQSWLIQGSHQQLCRVLRHNALDVLSMAALHRVVVNTYNGALVAGANRHGIARSWDQAGQTQRALALLPVHCDTLGTDASLLQADLLRREGQWQMAEKVWQRLAGTGVDQATTELSKYYEHQCRDYSLAWQHASRSRAAGRAKRLARLSRKMGPNLQLPLD